MKRIFEKKPIRYRLIIITIITILLFDLSFFSKNLIAAAKREDSYTQLYLGTRRFTYVADIWDLSNAGYINYHSDTVTSVNLHSMVQIVHNYGTVPIGNFKFVASSYDFNQYDELYEYPTAEQGETCRVEVNWHKRAKYMEYNKGPYSDGCVDTSLDAGANHALAGWRCIWFKNRREIESHW